MGAMRVSGAGLAAAGMLRPVTAAAAKEKISARRRVIEAGRHKAIDRSEAVSVGEVDNSAEQWLLSRKRTALWSGLLVYPGGRQLHALRDAKKAPLSAADEARLPEIVRTGKRYWHNNALVFSAPSVEPGEARVVKVVVRLNRKTRLKVDGADALFAPWNVVSTMGYVHPGNLSASAGYEPIEGG